MFWTIVGGVCVGILLAYAIIKYPDDLWDFIKTYGLLLLILLVVLGVPAIIIYTIYYGAKYGFDGWDSLPNLLKVGWLIIAVLIVMFGIFLNINDKEETRNDSTEQGKNCTNEKSDEVRKDNKNEIIIKKKISKSIKNK